MPSHNLRNGRLNQTAYSLYLFIRDIADGDLVGWIDDRLKDADDPLAPDRLDRMRQALLEPLRHVYGVSDKVLTMALSGILLAAPKGRSRWIEVGGSLIAIDTLVHNFLHRTGILHRFGAEHLYGVACYRPGGCADIVALAAQQIDARRLIRRFRPFSRGSCSTRSGATARNQASPCAMAIASMIASLAIIYTAKFASFVIV